LDEGADPYDRASYAKYEQPVYAPEISFEKLMGFVKSSKDDPFFLYWATPIPHLPLQAPRKWVDYYVDKFGDEEPYHFEKKGSYFPTRYPRATYAAMVSYLDENVGKLVEYLKAEGLYENTLIVFTSDNGPSYIGGTDSPWFDSGGPFESEYGRGKGFVHEGGIRVPMIASWPASIPAGTESDHISAFWDVLPTLCDVASVAVPSDTDGISFLNTLTNNKEEQEGHEFLYWEFPAYDGQVAIRMGKWKMIWKNITKGNTDVEIYNLAEDIQEQNDVAADHPELVTKFHELLKETHTTPEIERFRMKEVEEFVAAE
jgi:arylsulfatase